MVFILHYNLVSGQEINYSDSAGQKQGLWKYYFKGMNSSLVESEGAYLNNQRIGKWNYYVRTSDYYEVGRTIDYYLDSGYLIEEQSTRIYVNRDSAHLYYYRGDKVFTECVVQDSGKYLCKRYYPEEKYRFIFVTDFQNALKRIVEIWDTYQVGDAKKDRQKLRNKKKRS